MCEGASVRIAKHVERGGVAMRADDRDGKQRRRRAKEEETAESRDVRRREILQAE